MRQIIAILAVGMVIYLIRRLQGSRPQNRVNPDRGTPPAGERLVRDRICNTHLSPASAIRIQHDGSLHYFCSTACRDKFLSRIPAPENAPPEF